MKTVLILAGFVALAAASFPLYTHEKVDTVKLDEKLVDFQYKALSLFENVIQAYGSEYYTIGKEYDIEKNIDKYENHDAVLAFLGLWRTGITPKFYLFSIFQEKQREEAVYLYELFYSAKDFDTLYKTAAWAKVHLNEGQFLYAFYTALLQRADTQGIVLPSPYELWPQYFVNMEAMYRMVSTQLLSPIFPEDAAAANGAFKKDNTYYFYYNYSDFMSYENNEHRLAYFTEDIGWNSFYYYFHSLMPFWSSGEILGPFKERRGEYYYYFYQKLLSRYYLERLTNGLGEVPKFSWYAPLKAGYYPYLSKYFYPFAQRSNNYIMKTTENEEYIQFVDTYEKSFLQFLQIGQFKAFKHEVDFSNSKSMNFVGNFWQGNPDLYEKEGKSRNFERSYEQIARRLLGGAPKPYDDYRYIPTALDFYQTSLRDPVFYQLYGKIMNYIVEYKEWLQPYTRDDLHYVGVKINDIKVDELVTFFEYYDFNVTKAMYFPTKTEKPSSHFNYVVRQPRLNHKPFSVNFDIKSDIEGEVVIKLFMAPKYDGEGRPLSLDNNWMNFVELDWFTHKLTSGMNKVVRKSEDFYFYKEDSVSTGKIVELLKQGLVPEDMSENFEAMPSRLMLPRGTNGGFPVQFFAFVYPYEALRPEYSSMKQYVVDNTPFGYPFDRPISVPQLFFQPNMYFKDVLIYQHGPEYPWWNQYLDHLNSVPKN